MNPNQPVHLPLVPVLRDPWPHELPRLSAASADAISMWFVPAPVDQAVAPTDKCLAAQEMALALMRQHGLHGWAFRFNRAKRRLGLCVSPREGKPGRIEMSIHLAERGSEAAVKDTILHEVAHALVGAHLGHGPEFKAMCLRIGAPPERCARGVDMPRGKWRATCPECQTLFDRHRRPPEDLDYFCRKCRGSDRPLVWSYVRVD